jgi:hypothetical protein
VKVGSRSTTPQRQNRPFPQRYSKWAQDKTPLQLPLPLPPPTVCPAPCALSPCCQSWVIQANACFCQGKNVIVCIHPSPSMVVLPLEPEEVAIAMAMAMATLPPSITNIFMHACSCCERRPYAKMQPRKCPFRFRGICNSDLDPFPMQR